METKMTILQLKNAMLRAGVQILEHVNIGVGWMGQKGKFFITVTGDGRVVARHDDGEALSKSFNAAGEDDLFEFLNTL